MIAQFIFNTGVVYQFCQYIPDRLVYPRKLKSFYLLAGLEDGNVIRYNQVQEFCSLTNNFSSNLCVLLQINQLFDIR